MNNQVLFSIITVVRNNVETIEKAIKSVVENKPSFVEYIVIDGISTDGTLDIIEKYKDKIDIFISEKDKGATNAMTKGAKLATGKYIGYLFADDYYEGPVFEKALEAINISNAGIISIPCKIIDEKGSILKTFFESSQKAINLYNALYHPNIGAKLIKKEIFERNGYLWEQDTDGSNFIAADLEFMLKCSIYQDSFIMLDNHCCYVYLAHKNSTTFAGNKKIILKCYKEHIKIYERITKQFSTLPEHFMKQLTKWFHRAVLRTIYYELIQGNFKYAIKNLFKVIGKI